VSFETTLSATPRTTSKTVRWAYPASRKACSFASCTMPRCHDATMPRSRVTLKVKSCKASRGVVGRGVSSRMALMITSSTFQFPATRVDAGTQYSQLFSTFDVCKRTDSSSLVKLELVKCLPPSRDVEGRPGASSSPLQIPHLAFEPSTYLSDHCIDPFGT